VKKAKNAGDELRHEYRREHLGKAVRGMHFDAYQKGSNLVLLAPDVAKAFPTSDAVNEGLRGLLLRAEETKSLATQPARADAKVARPS
jgi:hypothetical protein